MSDLPRVSIVVTNYNQASFIGQAVQAALAQDYLNLEVILSDDGSTDHSVEVIQPFMRDARFRYCRNERNLKRVGNYRQALYHYMTGEWAMIVDGDDYLIDQRFVSKAMNAMRRYDDVVLIFGGCRMLTPDQRFKDHCETSHEWTFENGFSYFLRWGIWLGPPHQASMYRRDLATSLDFYRYDILSADWESLRRLVLRGNVLMHGQPVAVWRRHEVGASNTMDALQRIDDLKSITEPYQDGIALGFSRAKLDTWRRRTMADYVVNNVRASLLAGRPDCARDFIAYIRTHEQDVYQKCIQLLIANPQLGVMFALLQVGGRRLANWPSDTWRQLTWERMKEN